MDLLGHGTQVRGSTKRFDVLNESENWKAKAGRREGPAWYVSGDYVSSVLRTTLALSMRERDAAYGGACILVGLVEAQELRNGTKEVNAAYVTVVPLDAEGAEMPDKHLSRTIARSDAPRHPQWDELYCVGQKCFVEDAVTLRLKVKDYHNALSSDRLGVVDVSLAELREGGCEDVVDGWYDITTKDGRTNGSLHLQLFYHGPPADPVPISVGIRAVSASNLIAADLSGSSDPYVIMRVMKRTGKPETDAKGKAVALRTSIKKQILNPVWNEAFVFGDLSLAPVAVTGTEDWGWVGPEDKDLAAAPVTKAAVSLERAAALNFELFDSDFGKSDDPLGCVTLLIGTLLGDEDAVMHGHVLRVDKTYRVRPMKGMSETELGNVRLDVVLRFDEALTPEGWTEAIDTTFSGHSYYWHEASGVATWEQPASYATMAEDDGALHSVAAEVAGLAVGPVVPGDRAHKPPRPAGPPPHASRAEASPSVAGAVAAPAAVVEAVPVEVAVMAEAEEPSPVSSSSRAAAVPEAGAAGGDSDEEGAPVVLNAAAVDAAAGFGRKPKDVAVSGGNEELLSALSDAAPGDRQAAFMRAMRANADAKKAAEAEALQVSPMPLPHPHPPPALTHHLPQAKLRSFNPEERAEWDKGQEAEARRVARQSKMLKTQLGAFGVAGAAAKLRAGAGRAASSRRAAAAK
jgi:hypothetical protein